MLYSAAGAARTLRLKAGKVGVLREPARAEEDEQVWRLGGPGGQQRNKGQKHRAIVTVH